jgi:hypothetical protein
VSKNLIDRASFVALIILFLNFPLAFSQDINNSSAKAQDVNSLKTLTTDSVKSIVKEAIKESDQDKEQKHKQLISVLKVKLKLATEDWIVDSRRGRKLQLNTLRHENWEFMGKIDYPAPYDYYLRDFDYSIVRSELKENNLLSGYKGIVDIAEKLYVQTPHSSNAVDISKFSFALSRTITLNFEYTQDKFVISEVIYGQFKIEPNVMASSALAF